ncbi:hypothetical protein [Streptomyces sp. bgisy027]|uniref:hypothetical protein n=1 Tax=Streptomyces sp. bgisy027 TaxID=3413770 RepID=UPI003D73C82A
MRRDTRLEIITRVLRQPQLARPFVGRELREPVLRLDGGRNEWTASIPQVAEAIYTALYGRAATEPEPSPLARAEDAGRRRGLTGRTALITLAMTELIPGAEPDRMTVQVAERYLNTPHIKNTWSGTPRGLAEHIATAVWGNADGPVSPLAQAEDAKRRRDLVGEVAALNSGYAALTTAPWYPARPGDMVHVHYEAAGTTAAFGETYLVAASEGGFLSMQLLAHTLPEDTEFLDGMVGCFAVDDDPDPLTELWMEAGPHRLTIVRDGRPIHVGGAR